MEHLKRAIAILGGQSALARAVNVKQANVWHWLHKSKRVPGEFVLGIEAATNGQVTRYELRPDLYPLEGHVEEDRRAIDPLLKQVVDVANQMKATDRRKQSRC